MRNGFLNFRKDDELHQSDAELCVQVFFGKAFFIGKDVWHGVFIKLKCGNTNTWRKIQIEIKAF